MPMLRKSLLMCNHHHHYPNLFLRLACAAGRHAHQDSLCACRRGGVPKAAFRLAQHNTGVQPDEPLCVACVVGEFVEVSGVSKL